MKIVLLGRAGSGKDTLANKLASQYNFTVLTTGELYRKEAAAQTELGLRAKAFWAGGNLCPDEMTNELMKKAIEEVKDSPYLLFNGYPRTKQQAEFLDNIVRTDLALELSIDDETAVSRLLARKREDDTEEGIRQRLKVFHTNSAGIVEYYKAQNRYRIINSTLPPNLVFSQAVKIIFESMKH